MGKELKKEKMMEKILRIEKMENRFKNHISMMKNVYIGQIDDTEQKTAFITLVGLGITYATLIILLLNNFLNFGISLIIILGSLLILLYRTIIYDIVIPDKVVQIYKKAYYVYGYILIIKDGYWYHIDEIFFKQEEADDFILSLTSGVLLEKRECFKCKEEMNYVDYHRNNISKMTTLQLEKIWKSHHVQLFCCKCYNKNKKRIKKILGTILKLKNKR